MGFFDKLLGTNSESSQASAPEKAPQTVKLTAKLDKKTKTEEKRAPNPKLIAVTWADESRKKINKAKYGKELFLNIDTTNAYSPFCLALIVIRCKDWKEDYVGSCPITKFEIFSTGQTTPSSNHASTSDTPEKTIFSFIPQTEWLKKPDSSENEIKAEVYLLYHITTAFSGFKDNSPALKNFVQQIESAPDNYQGSPSKPVIIEQETTESLKLNYGGYYYMRDGTYLGKYGQSEDVYVCDGKNDTGYLNSGILMADDHYIQNEVLLRIAGTAYGESGHSKEVIKRIPFILINRHKQLKASKLGKFGPDWLLNKTLVDMRNQWTDEIYAHENHYGADGNGAFREFLGIKLNEPINYNKNAYERNKVPYIKIAIEYTIKAIDYYNGSGEDIAFNAVGWQGLDIKTNKNWKEWLYIHPEHAKNGFEPWVNKEISAEKQRFETVANYKGEKFGTTILYKSTTLAFKLTKTGL